jgi:DNA (cytosine-5)-methyltransferase 1
MNYYNEFDAKAAAWLRELIKAGLIPQGEVDERSICDITAGDLKGFTQCHFFAGIGGWSYALRLAGWPDDRPVWTGSCPCQPFSAAGKGLAQADSRHLWPVFFNLIRERRPDVVFGEQVEGAVGKGWLGGVCGDLESEAYACGHCVLGAHSLGAPHIRQRLYWVADSSSSSRREPGRGDARGEEISESVDCVSVGGVAYTHGDRATGHAREEGEERLSHWSELRCRSILCRDGKTRRIPVEPAFFPLADGVPARVVRLRGYGNAIVPQVAAAFVEAFLGRDAEVEEFLK